MPHRGMIKKKKKRTVPSYAGIGMQVRIVVGHILKDTLILPG